MGKSNEPDPQQQGSPEDAQPDDDDSPQGSPVLSLTPEQVRATPEYRALAKEARQLARQKGTIESQLAGERTRAEEARQAAEAERQAALQRQLREQLGEDGIAVYQEIAELSTEDPVAAAMRVAELVKAAKGQTPPAKGGKANAAQTAGAEEGNNVDGANANGQASSPPPPPGQGLDGGQPLGAMTTGEDINQIISGLEQKYAGVVERNQNPATRNRVTMKDRAAAAIAYIGAAYLKAGATPKG